MGPFFPLFYQKGQFALKVWEILKNTKNFENPGAGIETGYFISGTLEQRPIPFS